jgi:hypothetical protein
MSKNYARWNEVDNMMTGFIPVSDYERAINRKGKNDILHGETRPVSIQVPYAYAMYETIMTYLTQAFFSEPLFRFEGVGAEDQIKAKLLELVVNAQARKFGASLAMHTAMGDALKYGIGLVTFSWDQVYGKRPVTTTTTLLGPDGQEIGQREERSAERALLFEGNRVIPVDPYRFLPDPNVAPERIQEAQFCGWSSLDTYFSMLTQEKDADDTFNVRYLRDELFVQQYSAYTESASARNLRPKDQNSPGVGVDTTTTSYVTLVHIFVDLIPKEWKLPGNPADNKNGEWPEKWLFTVANDTLLVRAARHNLNHGMYPLAIAAPDSDGYSAAPVSRMEMLVGLQGIANWMLNSHVANVRKVMNDMLVVDPSRIVLKDLLSPWPGKIVRLRRGGWGRGVEGAVKQLNVQDVTRSNIPDSAYIAEIMQRVSAAVDSAQGIVRAGGERRSATEYRATASNALSRLEHIAAIISMQFFRPVAYILASQTQQFMSTAVYTKMVGSWPEELAAIYGKEGLEIAPEDILVDFDVIARDGSIPAAGAANADLLVQLFQIISSNPELSNQFDVARLFERIATSLGDKNVRDFIKQQPQTQVTPVPTEDLLRAAEQGNVVPIT